MIAWGQKVSEDITNLMLYCTIYYGGHAKYKRIVGDAKSNNYLFNIDFNYYCPYI